MTSGISRSSWRRNCSYDWKIPTSILGGLPTNASGLAWQRSGACGVKNWKNRPRTWQLDAFGKGHYWLRNQSFFSQYLGIYLYPYVYFNRDTCFSHEHVFGWWFQTYPSEKTWVRQLGWHWNYPHYCGKVIIHSCSLVVHCCRYIVISGWLYHRTMTMGGFINQDKYPLEFTRGHPQAQFGPLITINH